MGFGLIPGVDKIDYADMRNRILPDGTQWLSDDMENFMRQKLYDNNKILNNNEKLLSDIKSISLKQTAKKILQKDNKVCYACLFYK